MARGIKKANIVLTALLLIAALLAVAGCKPAAGNLPTNTPIQAKATPTATPAATARPDATPDFSIEPTGEVTATPDPDAFSPDDLNGIAQAEDVLPYLESYEEAKALNPDVVGWITIPGTSINYPVVRCDNNEFYLGRNVNRQKSRYGAIFMDFRNADPEQQRHIVLYGHNMKNGTMFHDLMNYKQQDFFDQYRTINFIWDGTATVWEIYLATVIPALDEYGSTIDYTRTRFPAGDAQFVGNMAEMIAYANTMSPSIVDAAVTISAADQVLTLSTCTYEYDNSRFAVLARRTK